MTPPIAVVLAAAALATTAQAAEPFKAYDTFSAQPINPARWLDAERTRAIKGGALQLLQRSHGLTSADSGLTFWDWVESFPNPMAITAIKAKITVNALEVNSCASSTAIGQSRARIAGSFFNTGIGTPGSRVGDALAQVRITRFSNSADPAGVMRVQGFLSICTSADCNSGSVVGNIVDLGTATVGQPVVVQMQWDQGAKSFLFSRDNGAMSGSVAYADSDTHPPSMPFKQLSTRMDIPSCMSAPRVTGMVDALFDNVLVNASAAP
jgi:hypothetical protein